MFGSDIRALKWRVHKIKRHLHALALADHSALFCMMVTPSRKNNNNNKMS